MAFFSSSRLCFAWSSAIVMTRSADPGTTSLNSGVWRGKWSRPVLQLCFDNLELLLFDAGQL